MAWAAGSAIAGNGNKTAATSISTGAITTGAAVGLVLVCTVTCDNAATSSSNSNTVTGVTDTKSNAWTKLGERTTSSGSAADGVCAAIFVTQVTNALVAASDSVTASLGSSITAKNIMIQAFTVGSGHSWQQAGTTQAASTINSTSLPSTTISGLTSAEYLFFALDGWEGTGLTYTKDADYTTVTTRNTTGGSALTNIQQAGGYRIATLTGDTNAASISSAEDSASLLVALSETSGVVNHPVTLSTSVASTTTRKVADSHFAPLVTVATSLPMFQRKMTPLRTLAVGLTTTIASGKAFGRVLTIIAALSPNENQQTRRALPATVTATPQRIVQAGLIRPLTASVTATKAGIIVLPHALTATVSSATSLIRQAQPIRSATATVAPFTRRLVSSARSIITAIAAPNVGFQTVNSLILATLATTVNPILALPRSIRSTRSTTVTVSFTTGPLTRPDLATSPNLLTGVYQPSPSHLLGRVLAIVASVTVTRPVVVQRTYQLGVGVASLFTKVTTGVPRIIAALITTSDREATTTRQADGDATPITSAESEATTMTGSEDV